jgi:hypothetical protein
VSVAMLTYVFERSHVRGSERLVLAVLADRADNRGVCWPGVADTARRAALSERQTRRVIRRLAGRGELIVLRRGGGLRRGGRGATNRALLRAGRSDDELRAIAGVLSGTAAPAAETRSPVSGFSGCRDGETLSCATAKPGPARPRNPVADDRKSRSRTTGEPSGKPAAEPSGEPPARSADDLSAVLQDERYRDNPHWAVQRLLLDAGCDTAFANEVAGRGASPERVADGIRAMRASGGRIANPGAWLRAWLQRNGERRYGRRGSAAITD